MQAIAIAVVENAGCLLIGQRPADVPLAGLWEFPGGKIEPGETPEQAAVRECLEESGLRVEALREAVAVEHAYPHGRLRLHFIACRVLEPAAPPTGAYRWIPRELLGNYDFPAGNHELLKLLRGEEERE